MINKCNYETFSYRLCVAGSYLRKDLSQVLPHCQSQRVSLLIRQMPRGNSLRHICNVATPQNLKKRKKSKIPLPIPYKESLWQGVFSEKNSYKYNCTEAKKDFHQKALQVQPRAQMYLSENLKTFLFCALC